MTATPSTTSPSTGLVRLYNKTERKFFHELADENGKRTRYELPAGTFGKVPPVVAELWLRMFPGQVVSDEEAHASINGIKAELEEAKKKIEELEKAKVEAAPAAPAPAPKTRKKTSSIEVV